MGQDNDLIARQYIVILEESLAQFVKQANERLFDIAEDLNRSKANLTILETKINSFEPDTK